MRFKAKIIIIPLAALLTLAYGMPVSYGAGNKKSPGLRLLGTVIEGDPAKSIAVIKNLYLQKQGVYKTLDKIAGYQIIKILRGQALLLKNGLIYSLSFPLGRETEEPILFVSNDKRIINRKALRREIPNLNSAAQQALPLPYIESGKILGLKIVNIKNGKLAKMAGLKDGDVLMRINGQNLNSIRGALALYPQIKNQERITLQIKRGAELKDLTYYLN